MAVSKRRFESLKVVFCCAGSSQLVPAAYLKDFDDVFWWIACETNTMRRLRSQLLKQPAVSKARLASRVYGQLATSNHPDHDYGES
ncbi:MAG: hypothetical protein AAF959_26310 [Cyanobacteria bacterium P01_D01_bin.56]